MAITDGTYRFRAVGEVVLGESAEKKTPFIEFYAQISEGENKGGKARYTGYFGPNSSERTVESLQICGWQGDDLSEFSDHGLHGLDANEFDGVVELEEWEDKETGEKRTTPRIRWINRIGGGGRVNVQNAMAPEAAASFGEKMKGLVLKVKNKQPAKGDGTDFPHGANAPAEPAKATGTGGRKY